MNHFKTLVSYLLLNNKLYPHLQHITTILLYLTVLWIRNSGKSQPKDSFAPHGVTGALRVLSSSSGWSEGCRSGLFTCPVAWHTCLGGPVLPPGNPRDSSPFLWSRKVGLLTWKWKHPRAIILGDWSGSCKPSHDLSTELQNIFSFACKHSSGQASHQNQPIFKCMGTGPHLSMR